MIAAVEFLLDAVRYFIEGVAASKEAKLQKGANA